jgi:hypothetical protein
MYARKSVEKHGHVAETDIQSFLGAVYIMQSLLEINPIKALKPTGNYTNHITDTPLDDALQSKSGFLSSGSW